MDLTRAVSLEGKEATRTARLTRHLKARLEDFGPGGPQVILADQDRGVVCFRVPGRESRWLQEQLAARWDIRIQAEGEKAVCRLGPQITFEELDRLWGCLFELLG